MSDYDAIVIGAGVIGCGIAFELAKAGRRTVVIDRLPGAGYGSTSSSSAIVRFSYSTRAGIALSWEARQCWGDWSNHCGINAADAAEFIPVPMLLLKLPGSSHYQRVQPLWDELGVPYDDLSIDELARRYPAVDFSRFGPPARLDDHDHPFWGDPSAQLSGALDSPDAGYINDPKLAARNLQTAAERAGTSFRFRREVAGIEIVRGRVGGVRLADGELVTAPVVVNVAGPHSSVVNAMAGVAEEMSVTSRALHREVYIAPVPEGVRFEAGAGGGGVMIGDEDVGVYFRPDSGNNVLVSSAEPDCDELIWVDDPDSHWSHLDDEEYRLMLLRAARRLPGLPIPQTKRGLTAMYDVTPDWLPIYDRSSLPGFYMAIGTSGNQFKNAPSAGYAMAALIEAIEGGHDHDHDPVEVVGPRTGLTIDMGTFSRLRPIDDSLSKTVFG